MKLLFSRFGINRILAAAILSIAMLCGFIALAISTTNPTIQSTSTATPLVSAPACTAKATYTDSFTYGQEASAEAEQNWDSFRQSLVPADYDTVTITGTFDTTGRTLTDATIVPQIATALQNGSSGSWVVGAVTWNVGTCGRDSELSANNSGTNGAAICSCQDPGYVVRPNIQANNSNWGGVNTATCS